MKAKRDRPDFDSMRLQLGRVESVDDLSCQARKINERYEKRAAIYAKRGLIEYYMNGEMYLGIRCISGEFKQFGFVFQRDGFIERDPAADYQGGAWVNDGGNKPFMLSENIELMECPKEIIPSVIWGVRFDDLNLSSRKPLFAFETIFWVDKVIDTTKNGKVRVSTGSYAVVSSQCCGEKIKRTPIGSDNCADFGINDSWQRFLSACSHDFFAGLRIRIGDNSLNASFPFTGARGESWELGVAPIDCSFGV
jgi:hypothetical protein